MPAYHLWTDEYLRSNYGKSKMDQVAVYHAAVVVRLYSILMRFQYSHVDGMTLLLDGAGRDREEGDEDGPAARRLDCGEVPQRIHDEGAMGCSMGYSRE